MVVNLKTPKGGGPFSVKVTSKDELIIINDVLIGEVWIASGQSNMAMPLKGWPPNDPIDNSKFEILNADFPTIRMFNVQKSYSDKPSKEIKGTWEKALPPNVGNFSATGYFFFKSIHNKLNDSRWNNTQQLGWNTCRVMD